MQKNSNECRTPSCLYLPSGMQLTVRKNKLRPFVFFRSSSEVMSLYWSGALEEKTSALSVSIILVFCLTGYRVNLDIKTYMEKYQPFDSQGNLMVEDEDQLLFFSNGMIVDLSSYGVISFDSSGQVIIHLTLS